MTSVVVAKWEIIVVEVSDFEFLRNFSPNDDAVTWSQKTFVYTPFRDNTLLAILEIVSSLKER